LYAGPLEAVPYGQSRPLLDWEGWDVDIIGAKLLDAMGASLFLLASKVMQANSDG
jgi:hypothetical protein